MPEVGLTRETIAFSGPRGVLTGELAYGETPPVAAALLIGPHPYMGGTMENNVIAHLGLALTEAELVTMRFSYRDVPSEALTTSMLAFWRTGRAPQDGDLVAEAVAARDWLAANVARPVVLIGYSFGAYAASEAINEDVSHVVLIAPTVKQHDLPRLRTSPVPKLVVYSADDFATSSLATETWFADLAPPKSKTCLIGGDHFFKREEAAIARRIMDFLDVHAPVPEPR